MARGAKRGKQWYGEGLPYLKTGSLPGHLIVIEGTDGVGRSTQIELLRPWLELEGFAVSNTGWTRSPLLADTINADIFAAEAGARKGAIAQVAFLVLVAALIALGLRVVGALLIVALIIIPPAAARIFARAPESMAILAGLIGALAAPLGLFVSFVYDFPAGPSIVLAAAAIFLLSTLAARVHALKA